MAAGSLTFSDLAAIDDTIYWLEGRPWQEGRVALMSWKDKEGEQELLPLEYSVRSRVHEYGGGALCSGNNRIYFVRDQDQQVYCLEHDSSIRKMTAITNARFADGCVHPYDGSLFYVMEEHGKEVVNSIVRIMDNGAVSKVAEGNDFYSNPRISPDGRMLAYIAWNNPNMPWDGTELWVLDLQSGQRKMIAGGAQESIADPRWSPDGVLYYISDRSNWWNLYRADSAQPVWAVEGELTLPQWWFNTSLYGFSGDEIVCSYVDHGSNKFRRIKKNGMTQAMDIPYTSVRNLIVADSKVVMIAASPTQPYAVVSYDLKNGALNIIKRSSMLSVPEAYIPMPMALEFPTTDNRTAHAFYYPPTSPDYKGLAGEKPPLLVHVHGGPTSHIAPFFSREIIYWTSRGFAFLEVNYGGSTGYGRAYRDRLNGQWGVVDVDDSVNAALYCVREGLADNNRLTIAGGSAGGFTTLLAIARNNFFKVGADYYGVTDLEHLLDHPHKFEARYLDSLVGLYPQERALYLERSPTHRVESITSPVIIFQGDEDAAVPPSQSKMMYEILVKRNIPTAYLLYKGEQHGFRKAENIKRSLEAQLYFFSKILNIDLVDAIEPVEIIYPISPGVAIGTPGIQNLINSNWLRVQ
jgi:dipeptidyl aminopeptidase/acylaminoacyl peptidase